MAKENYYFLSLDDKSKQIYEVKINNVQGYDPYQIKKENFQTILANFHQWHKSFLTTYFLFSLSPLTKQELKRYKSLECYNHLASGLVKEVKIKIILKKYVLKLPWLLDGSVRNIFPSLFYCSILNRCTVFVTSAKIREGKGSISPSSFYWQFPNY